MARPAVLLLLLLLALSVAITIAADAPAASPKPSKPFVLTPYAAVPPSESPSTDIFDDSDAAPIGAPSSDYPPDIESESAASSVGTSFVAMASVAGAVGYFLF